MVLRPAEAWPPPKARLPAPRCAPGGQAAPPRRAHAKETASTPPTAPPRAPRARASQTPRHPGRARARGSRRAWTSRTGEATWRAPLVGSAGPRARGARPSHACPPLWVDPILPAKKAHAHRLGLLPGDALVRLGKPGPGIPLRSHGQMPFAGPLIPPIRPLLCNRSHILKLLHNERGFNSIIPECRLWRGD